MILHPNSGDMFHESPPSQVCHFHSEHSTPQFLFHYSCNAVHQCYTWYPHLSLRRGSMSNSPTPVTTTYFLDLWKNGCTLIVFITINTSVMLWYDNFSQLWNLTFQNLITTKFGSEILNLIHHSSVNFFSRFTKHKQEVYVLSLFVWCLGVKKILKSRNTLTMSHRALPWEPLTRAVLVEVMHFIMIALKCFKCPNNCFPWKLKIMVGGFVNALKQFLKCWPSTLKFLVSGLLQKLTLISIWYISKITKNSWL